MKQITAHRLKKRNESASRMGWRIVSAEDVCDHHRSLESFYLLKCSECCSALRNSSVISRRSVFCFKAPLFKLREFAIWESVLRIGLRFSLPFSFGIHLKILFGIQFEIQLNFQSNFQ